MNGPRTVSDLGGIGIGPFNLSLAALLTRVPEVRAQFFEARPHFSWHSGLLFDRAVIQSPALKDLVTPVDPTNPYSFLNYLVLEHRINRFVVASYENAPRKEYNRYFQWVCRRLDSLHFATPIDRVTFERDRFVLHCGSAAHVARNLVLGVGHVPNIPDQALPHLGETVFHAGQYLERKLPRANKRIIVIGGGQTGAEVFCDLISDPELPAHVTWATRRHNFVPFDESAFANELYVPGYTKVFFSLPPEYRIRLIEQQKYSSDAILAPLLLDIYRKLYEFDYLGERRLSYRLLTDRRLQSIVREGRGWAVATEGPDAGEVTHADVVILATGFRFEIPALLDPILDRIHQDGLGRFVMNEDFSVAWEGPPENRIYAHNAALHTHGWMDPNFAGMAWRSAVIVNSLVQRNAYDLSGTDTAVDWAGGTLEPETHASLRR